MVPPIWRSLGRGQVEAPIKEADLYKYQRSGEAEKLAVRYREFRLPALLDAAVEVTGNKEAQCVKVLKCVEGQYNKALVLTMSTGLEMVARLPNPNAGPKFYTTASEVATRQFLRDALGIPIPRVYAWSADESNAVGAEYVLEEKATGQSLGYLWDQLSLSSRSDLIKQIVDMENKLASVSFPRHGCIYYQSDLESKQDKPPSVPIPKQNWGLPEFAIGPLTHPQHWQGKRALMDLDRGPWNTVTEYTLAIGQNEIQWAEAHAQPRMNYQRSTNEPETPADYINLQKYIKLAPYLIPRTSRSEQTNKISHRDLHLDNIFINPQTNRITSIIDWQHVAVSPLLLQRAVPQMLELSRNPTAECEEIETQLQQFYFDTLKSTNHPRRKVHADPLHAIRMDLLSTVPCCWDREDLFSLRHALIAAVARWDDIRDSDVRCPISFTDEELERHGSEMELIEGMSMVLGQLEEQGLIALGGMVPSEQYDGAVRCNEYVRQQFISMAEDEEQRELYARVWPYQ